LLIVVAPFVALLGSGTQAAFRLRANSSRAAAYSNQNLPAGFVLRTIATKSRVGSILICSVLIVVAPFRVSMTTTYDA
jgi:hypothetical protein